MPNYKIELRTENRISESFSVDTTDLDALRVEMARFVGELLRDHAQAIWADEEWRVDVTDERGLILFVLQIVATDSAATAPMRRGQLE